jgi:hypothetical protein
MDPLLFVIEVDVQLESAPSIHAQEQLALTHTPDIFREALIMKMQMAITMRGKRPHLNVQNDLSDEVHNWPQRPELSAAAGAS